ncbi:MAG: 50S ribosomal protein L13 [Alphaproteobacteria bacterium]|nr:MAG: 50S ribosomal protein L13 [Alphaproteobacteria bacterium]
MQTFVPKIEGRIRRWVLVDAQGLVLGRLATEIAKVLRGKDQADYCPWQDGGSDVVVVNAAHVRLTGKKRTDKEFHYHTGFPGGIKTIKTGHMLEGRFPERALKLAVQRMMPRGPLGRQQMSRLHVYAASEHPHGGQTPKVLDIASRNPKNARAI